MKTAVRIGVFLSFFLVLGSQELCAQNDTTAYRVELTNGNVLTGRLLFENEEIFAIHEDLLGEINIQKIYIKRIQDISSTPIVDGDYWFFNSQASRYFFSPAGYGIEKGTGYYQNVWVFFNQVIYGVTDNFTLGGGLVPLFLFAGAPTPLWVTAKVSQPLNDNKVSFGAGGLAGTIVGENTSFGILYGISTIGTRDRNISLGMGWGFADGEFARYPTANVNFLYRFSSRGYLISENYYLDDGFDPIFLFSLGGRHILGGGTALDYGLLMPIADIGDFVGIPWLGLTFPLGGKNQESK